MRRDVEFALTQQPGQESAAVNGDGHSVVELSWFEGKVTPEWMHAIEDDLVEEIEGLEGNGGHPLPPVQGVSLLDFHCWAGRLVLRRDPNFSWQGKIGRGAQARSIETALVDWINNQTTAPITA